MSARELPALKLGLSNSVYGFSTFSFGAGRKTPPHIPQILSPLGLVFK